MMQYLNIKAILFGVSVYSLFNIEFYKSLWMIQLFAIFLTLNTFVVISDWAFGGIIFRNLGQKYYRVVNVIKAWVLIRSSIAGFL